jgi:DNA-binding NarL/FixJ family response regulator
MEDYHFFMSDSTDYKLNIGICETQPLVVAGLRALVQSSGQFAMLEPTRTLDDAIRLVVTQDPRVLILDKAFGIPTVMDFLARMRGSVRTGFIVWGSSMTEPEALRFVKGGARGVLRKTAEPATVLTCLRVVADGGTWLEDALFHTVRQRGRMRSELTVREQQVLELVEQGLRNKEIATELGIQPGTVKIHLKHIFEKTGVRGRYGLALTGLQQRVPMGEPALV